MTLPRVAWVKLNRLRTGVGRFRLIFHQWSMAPNPTCDCGPAEQTADHILLECPTFQASNSMHGLVDTDDHGKEWLITCLSV